MRAFIKFVVLFVVLLVILQVCSQSNAQSKLPPVDVEIIIAVDVSDSISNVNYALQKEGMIAAFKSDDFRQYLDRNKYGISVLYMEWSGMNQQHHTMWYKIQSMSDVPSLLNAMNQIDRVNQFGNTAMANAMLKAYDLFDNNPYPGMRKVLDISGDGVNNVSLNGLNHLDSVLFARDNLIQKGVTINGLPVQGSSAYAIEEYYRENVIGGPSAFAILAKSFEEFAAIFLRKLITEIS